MHRGKKMQTPSKQPESSSMNHEEEEEMQHDISKLRDQAQQVSLAQKVTESKMDELKKDVEAKMNGLKNGVAKTSAWHIASLRYSKAFVAFEVHENASSSTMLLDVLIFSHNS